MGGEPSKPVQQQKPPVSEVKFKNEKQAKVFTALSAIHQVRATKLSIRVKHPTGKYSKKDIKVYTWHARPRGGETEEDDRVFRDHILHLKTKANGRVDSMVEYSHSEVDVVFHDDMNTTGFDTISYNWFKPSAWIDELKIDADLRSVQCRWLMPMEAPVDARGKRVKNVDISPEMVITINHPIDYLPLSLRVAFDNETTELEMEKGKKELKFFQGSITQNKPGETVLTIEVKKLMLTLGYDEKDDISKFKLVDYPIRVTFDLAPPPMAIQEYLDQNGPKKFDKPLEKEDFKELLLWQRPLPRTFIPDTKPLSSIAYSVERYISCVDKKWSKKTPTQVPKKQEPEPELPPERPAAGPSSPKPAPTVGDDFIDL